MLDFTEYTKIFISLFAILDPIGMIPVIILLTSGMSTKLRRQNGRLASLTVFLILLTALLIGEHLLAFFGISIYSLGLAGGILLMVMAFQMLNGNIHQLTASKDELKTDSARSLLAVVPLSTPLLAGPGSISTVILNAHKAPFLSHYLVMSLIIFLLSVTVWLTFLAAPWVERRVGALGIDIFTRLMGLLLAAIAVEIIAVGIRGLLPALG